ncbi:hypothetical protein [Geofilum rhodophaeum]|uniref:hypothetical protein n=1 Tax=Geofilum rhodophaeum TaxID=1965019 RepID=UPI000B51ECD3|nr:hypothetical protein [Geofilum rhodophaeum]
MAKQKHGRTYTQRIFEIHRSQRLHWVKYHIDEKTNKKIEIFSTEERINGKKKMKKKMKSKLKDIL